MASSSLGHGAQAGADQPADGEEGGGDVDDEQGEGGDEHVQVELGWHPAALVPAAVHVAEHPHLQNIVNVINLINRRTLSLRTLINSSTSRLRISSVFSCKPRLFQFISSPIPLSAR